jgi:DNA-damage-inducible protein D
MDKLTNHMAIFQGNRIRRVLHDGEWWFVITDIIAALTNSANPSDYLKKIKKRDTSLSEAFKGGDKLSPPLGLLIETPGGRQRLQCWNTEGVFRLIQSVPSPQAEPFKRWLARVGYERVQEIENPEIATLRTRALYKLKGYSEDWIEKRMRGIVIRDELTDEWKKRGAAERKDYEILTSEISKATFGVTPSQYKKLKGLKRENLRDHMDDFELIFTMLGERSTTEIHRNEASEGVTKLKADAKAGGDIAGGARRALEKRLGKPVVSKGNYLKNSRKRVE